MVQADVELILVVDLLCGPAVVVGGTRRVRQRVPLEKGERDRIHPVDRNRVAGERRSGESAGGGCRRPWIVNDRDASTNRLGEHSLSLQQRRNGRKHGPPDRLPLTLVVQKEERPIPNERSAQRAAVLVAPELRLRGIRPREDIAGVQRLVPEELEAGAVKRVASGPGRQVHDAPIESTEFGRRTVALDPEFLNRIDDRKEGDLTRLGLQHRDPVEQIFVRAGSAAVDAGNGCPGGSATPGASTVSEMKLRPFSGRSTIFSCSTTWPRLAVSCRSRGTSASSGANGTLRSTNASHCGGEEAHPHRHD
jgi:hypothetical protein